MIFLQFAKLLKFANFNFIAHLDCLNGFIVLMALYGQCLPWPPLFPRSTFA